MKMKSIYLKSAAILIIAIPFLASCTEDATIDYNQTYTRLVVEGEMTTDTTVHTVKLSRSGPVVTTGYDKVTQALVTITDGSTVFNLHENPSKPGTYETDANVYGIPGKTYTLSIKNVDIDGNGVKEEYTASSYLPNENPIDSITLQYDGHNEHYRGWLINLYAQEIGGGRNFYLMKAYRNNKLVTDSIQEYNYITDNTGFNGIRFDGFSVYMMNYDKLDERLAVNDTVTLEMDGISHDYYSFVTAYVAEYNPKVPIFSGPSANIPTNIVPADKSVGFFTAYSIKRKSVIYRGK